MELLATPAPVSAPEATAAVSFIVPAYNEEQTIVEVLARLAALPLESQIVVVDDGSSDGTSALLDAWAKRAGDVVVHQENRGKGAAIRAALPYVSGAVVVIQDADLELRPEDVPALVAPVLSGEKDVVYGSRFLGGRPECSLLHRLGNWGLNKLTNLLYGTNLTDMETCYKVMPSAVFRELDLREDRFGFEPEVTAQLCLLGLSISELPVAYRGRTRAEGKKLSWRDGAEAASVLLRSWLRAKVFPKPAMLPSEA